MRFFFLLNGADVKQGSKKRKRSLFGILKNQKGAMFGLDARIALYIFGGIGAIATGATLTGLFEFKAQGLAEEIRSYRTAIEGIHEDIEEDLFDALASPSNSNLEAVQALWDSTELTASYRPDWRGPYVTWESATHKAHGDIRLYKYQDDASSACNSSNLCYIWLSLSAVDDSVADELNDVMDGDSESNPNTSGTIRIVGSSDTVQVLYRITRALTISS